MPAARPREHWRGPSDPRDRLTPAAVGLPAGRRRRTKGLRREEIAYLAGIGAAWYTWLEQARDIRPSEIALRHIARALRLTDPEKRYFLELALDRAQETPFGEPCDDAARSTLDTISGPAFVLGLGWDLLAYNEAANAVFDFDYMPVRNFMRMCFTPQIRAFARDWEATARNCVAHFRGQHAGLLKNPKILELVDELKQQNEEFRGWWAEQTVSEERRSHKVLDHPFVGRLAFDQAWFLEPGCGVLKLGICVWDGAQTRQRMDELIRQLRAGLRSSGDNLWTTLDGHPRQTPMKVQPGSVNTGMADP